MKSILYILISIMISGHVSAQLDSSFSVAPYPTLLDISDDLVDAEDHLRNSLTVTFF